MASKIQDLVTMPDGRRITVGMLASENGIQRQRLYKRIYDGWDPVTAATTPLGAPRGKPRYINDGDETLPLSVMLDKHGISPNRFWNKLYSGPYSYQQAFNLCADEPCEDTRFEIHGMKLTLSAIAKFYDIPYGKLDYAVRDRHMDLMASLRRLCRTIHGDAKLADRVPSEVWLKQNAGRYGPRNYGVQS